MCGEQEDFQTDPQVRLGSPPRVRGTDTRSPLMSDNFRITPACAGNSRNLRQGLRERRDHPRVCGEQSKAAFSAARIWGSPPRVRGTAEIGLLEVMNMRITPACAGNSSRFSFSHPYSKDHPRVCGEQMKTSDTLQVGMGSPPRVRGTVDAAQPQHPHGRITPACAGNRCRCWPGSPPRRDHPRVCGEQNASFLVYWRHRGSPPRVRGTD